MTLRNRLIGVIGISLGLSVIVSLAQAHSFTSPPALTARARYDRAIQEANTRYVQDLRAALQLATRRANLAEVAAIQAEIERLTPSLSVSTTPVGRPASGGPVKGRNWTSPSTDMIFVWIEALSIWVGKFEVTNREYRLKERLHDSGIYRNHSLNLDRQPVVQVSFDDAKVYAAWLTEQDQPRLGRLRYRLPSEQEWVTFARCGDDRIFPWGNEWPPPRGRAGNYHGDEGAGSPGGQSLGFNDQFPVTALVDRLWSNPWGLHGVGGNVAEICAQNSSGETLGALRGGSWGDTVSERVRISWRNVRGDESRRNEFRGFRLVLSQ